MRRAFAAAGVLAALVAVAAAADFNAGTASSVPMRQPEPAESVTVAIIGDQTFGDPSGLLVLERAVDEINLLRPDLVIHIGDMVPGYTRDMDQWRRDVARVKAILDRLQAPFYPIVGNHDVITGTGDPADRRGEDIYRATFGPLYYSFDCKFAHFICLDTDEELRSAPRFSRAQLDWLARDLDNAGQRPTFLFLHKPVWDDDRADWGPVRALLRGRNVRAVFAGHYHHYFKSVRLDGIQYYVLGATGGQCFSPELAGGLEHYSLLHIEPESCSLALIKPGAVLPDDYVSEADYTAARTLRSQPEARCGIAAAIQSPERGPVDEQLTVIVSNPLDQPIEVFVRGLAGGAWTFNPTMRTVVVAGGERKYVYLGIRSPKVEPAALTVPRVEVQYNYVDSRGRTVPTVLERRVPLAREAAAPLARPSISLDGRADEPAWAQAPLLTAALWQNDPYATGQTGPVFRVLPTATGVYVYAEATDAQISDFRGDRMLSDALFVGALSAPAEQGATGLEQVPVVVIYPFSPSGGSQAIRAFWHPDMPMGPPVPGVHVATTVQKGLGWRCEAFVPWDALLADGVRPGDTLCFNVGAWDNDGTYFSELRSWAPTRDAAGWGRLILAAPAVR